MPAPRPVRPREAATLVLTRDAPGGRSVLMGRRGRRHRFLPDVFVFPGGGVEPGDATAPVAHDLDPLVAARLGRRARALAVAAVRETFEETGLLLGETRPGGAVAWNLAPLDYRFRAITPPASPIRYHARFLYADARHATGALGGSGELIDLDFYPLDAALALPVIDVTQLVLERLAAGAAMGERVPLFCGRGHRMYLRR